MAKELGKTREITVENVRMHMVDEGEGEPLLLLHGWPTSSYLWRHMVPELAKSNRVIVPDLPGFGKSDKPLDASYSFRFFDRMIDGIVKQLELAPLHLVVHDLGGPLGLYWATQHPEKVRSLVLLNTTVFPMESWAVKLFMTALYVPGVRSYLTSQHGLKSAINVGLFYKKEGLTPEEMAPYQEPFVTKEARLALLKTAQKLSPKAFPAIVEGLTKMTCPIRLLYGEKDRILPAVAREMNRLQQLIPHAQLSSIPNTGHFLQEDNPEPVTKAILDFLKQSNGAK